MQLVIVESPTKAKTIGRFLGKEYTVESSYGHVRDLPKSRIGIDVEHDFTPKYVIPKKATERVAELAKLAKKADGIILATDEDREGEAIAWHLTHALGLVERRAASASKKQPASKLEARSSKLVQRIVFHEITEDAIKEALKNPREIDLRLVDAQQARRILDRLVGYELSPFLWRKVRYGLSAGRVQSVAVRLIVEREREIEKFLKEEYWTIEAEAAKRGDSQKFAARLTTLADKALGKMDLGTEAAAEEAVKAVEGGAFTVKSVAVKQVNRNPAPPFTTSTLQQEASRKLGFSAKQTMTIAQRLYEQGRITYMRTDSVSLAASALAQAREVVIRDFGEKYALAEPRRYQTKAKGAQEAHEAIRPTDLRRDAKGSGIRERGEMRLYELIRTRTLASQMQSAEFEQTAADIADERGNVFRANGQRVVFDGFIRAYTEGRDEGLEDEVEGMLPELKEGDEIDFKAITPIQHFTEPPPRYTDASLVKALESYGIGRPSTYAPTLSTIQDRGYVEKIEKKYKPTEIGVLVNDLLVEHFPEIVDINFTSRIEEEFDEIAEGQKQWVEVAREFYTPFKKHLSEKEASVEKHIELSDTPCPHCGKPMIIKFGRMGKFLACPEPGVKVTLPMPEEQAEIKALEEKTKDERCPLCGSPMSVKRGRFGYFLGCSRYPECKGVAKIWNKTGFKCPSCLESEERKERPGDIVEKKSRGRGKPFYACTRWPDCTFLINKRPESEAELQELYQTWKTAPKDKKKKPLRKKPAKKSASATE